MRFHPCSEMFLLSSERTSQGAILNARVALCIWRVQHKLNEYAMAFVEYLRPEATHSSRCDHQGATALYAANKATFFRKNALELACAISSLFIRGF